MSCCNTRIIQVTGGGGGAHSSITSIDLSATGNVNEYTVTLNWVDANGLAQVTTDTTPVIIVPAAIQDIDGDTYVRTVEGGASVGGGDRIEFVVDGITQMTLDNGKLSYNGLFLDPAFAFEMEQHTLAEVQAKCTLYGSDFNNTLWIDSVTGHAFRGLIDLELTVDQWDVVEHFNSSFDPAVTYTGDKELLSIVNTGAASYDIVNLAGNDVTVAPNEKVNITYYDGSWHATEPLGGADYATANLTADANRVHTWGNFAQTENFESGVATRDYGDGINTHSTTESLNGTTVVMTSGQGDLSETRTSVTDTTVVNNTLGGGSGTIANDGNAINAEVVSPFGNSNQLELSEANGTSLTRTSGSSTREAGFQVKSVGAGPAERSEVFVKTDDVTDTGVTLLAGYVLGLTDPTTGQAEWVPVREDQWETVDINAPYDVSVDYVGIKELVSIVNLSAVSQVVSGFLGADVTLAPNERLNVTYFDGDWFASTAVVDLNLLENDLTQDADRTHDFASFNQTWNDVGDLDINSNSSINAAAEVLHPGPGVPATSELGLTGLALELKTGYTGNEAGIYADVNTTGAISMEHTNAANTSKVELKSGSVAGATNIHLTTNEVHLGNATNGQVLSLVDAATGEVEFATPASTKYNGTFATGAWTSTAVNDTITILPTTHGLGLGPHIVQVYEAGQLVSVQTEIGIAGDVTLVQPAGLAFDFDIVIV